MQPDRAFVIECYRRILGREPENEAAIEQVLQGDKDIWALIALFTDSQEFRSRAARLSSHSLLKAFDHRALARPLSDTDRMRSVLVTYSALNDQLAVSALRKLFSSGLRIIDDCDGLTGVTVDAMLFQGSPIEGEVSLIASFEGRRVAVLTYTRAPSYIFDLAGNDVLLISRLQGFVGVGQDTRELSRRLGDISPPYLLMAVLEGVAAAQGCERIIGVSAEHHPDYKQEKHSSFAAAYDTIFTSLRSIRLPSGLHLMTPPLEGRSLSSISPGHRSRTRQKRATKRAIVSAAQERWQSYMRPTNGSTWV